MKKTMKKLCWAVAFEKERNDLGREIPLQTDDKMEN